MSEITPLAKAFAKWLRSMPPKKRNEFIDRLNRMTPEEQAAGMLLVGQKFGPEAEEFIRRFEDAKVRDAEGRGR